VRSPAQTDAMHRQATKLLKAAALGQPPGLVQTGLCELVWRKREKL